MKFQHKQNKFKIIPGDAVGIGQLIERQLQRIAHFVSPGPYTARILQDSWYKTCSVVLPNSRSNPFAKGLPMTMTSTG